MIKINRKIDSTYGSVMYEFMSNGTIMKWFTNQVGDLYFNLFVPLNKNTYTDFIVDKKDDIIYNKIDNIYNDFKNGTIFYQTQIDNTLKYNASILNRNQALKDLVHNIYNTNTNTVTWQSDEGNYEKRNVLQIFKIEDKYILRFINNTNQKLTSICFKKIQSHYGPCSLPFIRAYESMDAALKLASMSDVNNKIYYKKNEN